IYGAHYQLVDATPEAAEAVPLPKRSRRGWLAAAVLAAAFIAGAAMLRQFPSRAPEPWTFRPLTYSGQAFVPALSPDGKQVAFVWTDGKSQSVGLYVQLVNGGSPLQ